MSGFALTLLAMPCPADPPGPQARPNTFVYAPVPQPVKGILQYGQAPDGRLTPLKPPLLPERDPYIYVSNTDPKGHFLYLGTEPPRRFRISRNGQLVLLKPATVSAPAADAMAFTPDGRFLYLSHTHNDDRGSTNTPDDLITHRVAANGTLHPIRGGMIS